MKLQSRLCYTVYSNSSGSLTVLLFVVVSRSVEIAVGTAAGRPPARSVFVLGLVRRSEF